MLYHSPRHRCCTRRMTGRPQSQARDAARRSLGTSFRTIPVRSIWSYCLVSLVNLCSSSTCRKGTIATFTWRRLYALSPPPETIFPVRRGADLSLLPRTTFSQPPDCSTKTGVPRDKTCQQLLPHLYPRCG